MARTIIVETPDGLMDVYFDEPEQPGPGARVILMFPRSGMDGFPQRIAHWLAENGHPVVCPDITYRCPADMPIRDRKAHLKDDEIVRDIGALIRDLREHGGAKVPLAIMGHCMGGRHALLGASAFHEISGAAAYYSGDMMKGWGRDVSPFDLLSEIRCPVIGFFGAKDKNPSPADVDRMEARLLHYGIVHRFHRYPQVAHAFQQNADRSAEERQVADHSAAETLRFLRSLGEPRTSAVVDDDGPSTVC